MSTSYTKTDLEARIVELENQLKKQDKKIRLLGTLVTFRRSSPFDDPLKQFFDAPEFWEVIYEDAAACHNSCYEAFKGAYAACNGDKDCLAKVVTESIACREECGVL